MVVNAFTLQRKYPQLQVNDINNLIDQFNEIDLDQDGYLDHNEIRKACKDTGYSDNYDEIRATLKDVSTNTVGKIDVEEFIEVMYYRA
ncbi:hypothetical protein G6F45_010773 [Rhizopus arrhizus]|uniref:EF-hand domain-containing protein n=1 Tax=Rhizopus delemar TaxID=936053 RepID=A0A9P7CJR9_9FUNG|nr:hypothetical protein G6F52_009668 [Rhizopus delemar]KAG1564689.1 hypothetical protein G6F50_010778 [Rhizopus delemar]KAG1623651.1 hypothetical protein G6F45_010773 [Rhizopus arrhizus]